MCPAVRDLLTGSIPVLCYGLRHRFPGQAVPGSARPARARGYAGRAEGGVRMRPQGDDEPARRRRRPRRRAGRPDRDRRQRPLYRLVPPPFLRAIARKRSPPAEPESPAEHEDCILRAGARRGACHGGSAQRPGRRKLGLRARPRATGPRAQGRVRRQAGPRRSEGDGPRLVRDNDDRHQQQQAGLHVQGRTDRRRRQRGDGPHLHVAAGQSADA